MKITVEENSDFFLFKKKKIWSPEQNESRSF